MALHSFNLCFQGTNDEGIHSSSNDNLRSSDINSTNELICNVVYTSFESDGLGHSSGTAVQKDPIG